MSRLITHVAMVVVLSSWPAAHAQEPIMEFPVAESEIGECFSCGTHRLRACHGHGCIGRWRCNSTCDMPQHVPYTLPGYYYFRPYNYTRIAPQQEAARRWGGDWRNPYDNRFLQKIADELADEASTPEEIPKLPNTSLGQPRHSDALDTPTRPHEPMVRLAPPIVSP